MSDEDVAESAISGCDGIFHFYEKCKNRNVRFCAVAVKALHLFRGKALTNVEETGAECLVKVGLVLRADRKEQQCQKDPRVRKLLTVVNKSLSALVARSGANGDGSDTRYVKAFYVHEQSMLLNVLD